jgi:exodeoxyribonuclease-3
MKIVSWNVNSIGTRLDRLLAFLKREEPDYLCLQELKCIDEKFPMVEIRAAGYFASVFGQKAYNGVAILSRSEPEQVQRGFSDSVDDPASRFIAAKFGQLWIMSAYVPNGQEVGSEKYAYKMQWLKRMKQYLAKHHQPSEPILLVGDFNIAPDDIDVYDPVSRRETIHCSKMERDALKDVMTFGLKDLLRVKNPSIEQYTWWDYRQLSFPKNLGMRIDLLLSTPPLINFLETVRVDRDERKGEKPSDHAPLIAEFSV